MTTTTIATLPFPFPKTSPHKNPPPKSLQFHPPPIKKSSLPLHVSNCIEIEPKSTTHFIDLGPLDFRNSEELGCGVVSFRLRRLVQEFRALYEPIDRVKRLLDYAAVLPPVREGARSLENRVAGCAAQVWLEVEMDEDNRMRFGAESDSEITKGFCSCLIYLLDGASPDEVLQVKAEDLADMNVGLPVRSRVNSWHNVLVSIQDRTRALVAQKEGNGSLGSFASLVISTESNITHEDGILVP